jgi:TRAP transporter TAXI family solute receptor
MNKLYRGLAAGAVILTTAMVGSTVAAQDVKLPRTMAWTAYGTGSGGYNQVVSIGNLLQNKYNTSVRILPGDNDVSRMTPLRTGRVDICACGIASYYVSEGVELAADPEWGPQPIRVIITSKARFGLGVAVAGDVGVKTPADLKGKRVAFIRGDNALNIGTEAYLAFGGLTWNDVQRVTFPGYGRSFEGIIGNQVDAAFTMSVTPPAQQLAASPRGIVWPELDPNNTEGWKRMQTVAPYFQPHKMTAGAGGVSADKPVSFASYPYPIVVTNATYDANTAYNLVKVLIENHAEYKDAAPGNDGYALEQQEMTWVVPFHDGVVRYYKERGIWTPAMQQHQDTLVKRQQILADAWKKFTASNPPREKEQFAENWMKARATALEAAGMNPVFR